MDTALEVKVHAIIGPRTTLAVAEAFDDDDGVVVMSTIGESHRDLADKQDDRIGLALACGRALQSLGRKIERAGEGAVKHADDVKAQQAAKPETPRMRAFGGDNRFAHEFDAAVCPQYVDTPWACHDLGALEEDLDPVEYGVAVEPVCGIEADEQVDIDAPAVTVPEIAAELYCMKPGALHPCYYVRGHSGPHQP